MTDEHNSTLEVLAQAQHKNLGMLLYYFLLSIYSRKYKKFKQISSI